MSIRLAGEEQASGALRSSVSWALLGLVIQRPSYGYELVQRFERTYEDMVELSSPSQVYKAIDTLAGRGLIEKVLTRKPVRTAEADRQPKVTYRATEAGTRAYRDWLMGRVQEERRHSRLFACQLALLAPADALEVIERYERVCLEHASTAAPAALAGGPDGAGALLERLMAEQERLAGGARLPWVEYARRELTALIARQRPAR